ncbi:hypothetical protein TSAR_004440 [Trichomalopsis sarcophagae]|uniref:Gustatory receptor n=1 Tax=Trichomalopsis sarcophagae TaxID=543379 RepID=A0A232EIC2_9HYME|nr:hypothetical protein TSAR_004440 [Trichomalopsis sarcophagae]
MVKGTKYLFDIFKVFGLATMSMTVCTKKNNFKNRKMFSYSYHGIIYNGVLICFLIIAGIYKMYYIQDKLIDQSRMSEVIDVFGNFIIYAVSVVLLSKYMISQTLAVRIGNNLYSINLVLERFNLKYKNQYMIMHYKLVLLFDLTIWLGVIIIGSFSDCTFIAAILTYIPNFIINCLVIQYVVIIIFIYGEAKALNNQFRKYVDRAFSDTLLYQFRRPILSAHYYLPENNEIILLQKSCLSIYEVSNNVSKFYSLSILICIVKLFFSIILNTYFFLKPSIFGKNIITSTMNHVWSISWLTLDTFSLCILTQYITMTVNEIKKTGDIVHQILRHSTGLGVIKQLNNFSLHLLHKNIQFTAMDMFSLDCTLLHSIVGSITTYLVILIQFQENSSEQHKP